MSEWMNERVNECTPLHLPLNFFFVGNWSSKEIPGLSLQVKNPCQQGNDDADDCSHDDSDDYDLSRKILGRVPLRQNWPVRTLYL